MLDLSILRQDDFEPGEFIKSGTADREKIDNSVHDAKILFNLVVMADKIQEIRDLLNNPIRINSGYRCLKLNRMVGSKDSSQHIQGQAVDFICPKFGTPEEIVFFLKEYLVEVDQCLVESSWVHLSIKEMDNRNQFAYYKPNEEGEMKFTLIT